MIIKTSNIPQGGIIEISASRPLRVKNHETCLPTGGLTPFCFDSCALALATLWDLSIWMLRLGKASTNFMDEKC